MFILIQASCSFQSFQNRTPESFKGKFSTSGLERGLKIKTLQTFSKPCQALHYYCFMWRKDCKSILQSNISAGAANVCRKTKIDIPLPGAQIKWAELKLCIRCDAKDCIEALLLLLLIFQSHASRCLQLLITRRCHGEKRSQK